MRGTAKQTAPRRRPLGFLSVLGATSKVREEAMAEVEEEEGKEGEEKEDGRGREEETSRRNPRGLAIFQWDLLEHHSKALRPPGQASHLPSPWHLHLVPSHSTLSFGLRREREKGLCGRDERCARLVSTRGENAAQLIILFSRRARQTARAFH